ncbi:MFS transporter [Peribacillus butanolivorans]|uniref:MFS transporter n=1 Tax=Peribacillus butanolivorans TaxID=421767 RepID=UPI00365C14E4
MGRSGNKGVNRNKYIVLVLLCISWFMGYLDRVSMSIAILPIGNEMSLNPIQTGFILSSFFLGYAIMQPIGGWLADKFGSRKVLITAITLWSIFTLLTGVAWSFASLIVIRILFGLGEGSFPSASSVAIGEFFPKTERARAKTMVLSSTYVASAIGAVTIALFVDSYGWKLMFIILGALGFVVSALLFFYLRPPVDKGENISAQSIKKVSLAEVMRTPLLWQLVIILFGMTIAYWGINSWMPSYWVNVRGLDLVAAGFSSAIPPIASFITILSSGWVLDKYMEGREKYLITIGALLGALFLYLTFNSPSVVLAVIFMTLCQMSLTFIQSATFVIPLKSLPENFIGTTSGIINFGGQVGSTISPAVLGFLISKFDGSYDAGFWFLIAMLVMSTIVSLTIRSEKKSFRLSEEEIS